jgi:hypothetical protein
MHSMREIFVETNVVEFEKIMFIMVTHLDPKLRDYNIIVSAEIRLSTWL